MSAGVTLREFLVSAIADLHATSASPRVDAESLLMHVRGITRADLIAHSARTLEPAHEEILTTLLERRKQGEPIAYLTGGREFWSLALKVTPATLIPRPETELLVEQVLAHIPPNATWTVGDLGTGCGAIALAVAKERPRCQVVACDHSVAALAVAGDNAARLGISNVQFLLGDWFQPMSEKTFDVIASNPPYISQGDRHLAQGDVRFEPMSALVAGVDGLDAIRVLASRAPEHLRPGGWLLLEHGVEQAAKVKGILSQRGYRHIKSFADLSAQARVIEAQFL